MREVMLMRRGKCRRLEAAGFRLGTAQEFLGLSDEEAALIEMKLRLVAMLKSVREARHVTQQQLARRMASSQSRVAKLEGAASGASLDLICIALFSLGATPRDLGLAIAAKKAA
jgi:hypothetical protein